VLAAPPTSGVSTPFAQTFSTAAIARGRADRPEIDGAQWRAA
jgi:hypothetical protein